MRSFVVVMSVLLIPSASTVSGQPATWRLDTVWQIGDAARPDYDLARIGGIAVAADGTVYVGQPQDPGVRIFDANGRFRQRMGRSGRGPGELESVYSVRLTHGGIDVLDVAQRRLLSYDSDGQYRDQWGPAAVQIHGRSEAVVPMARFSDGSRVGLGPADPDASEVYPIIRIVEGTSTVLGSFRTQSRNMRVRLEGANMVLPRPFSWQGFWSIDPKGTSLTLLDQPVPTLESGRSIFTVRRLSQTGDTLFSSPFSYPVRRIPPATWDSLSEERLAAAISVAARMGRSAAEVREAVRRHLGTTILEPAVDAMVVADDGAIWLRRVSFGQSTVSWYVLDPQGKLVATVRAPADWEIEAVVGNHAYISTTAEYDIPRVIKASIHGR